MPAEGCCKSKAALLLVIVAAAESHKVQQYVRFVTDRALNSGASISRAGGASANSRARNLELNASLADPNAQELLKFVTQRMDVVLEEAHSQMVRNPKLKDEIRSLTDEVRAIMEDPVLHELATFVAEQLKTVTADAYFQKIAEQLLEQAKKVVIQMQTIMTDPSWDHGKALDKQVEVMEAIMASPRFQVHARRIVKQLEAMTASQNFQHQATRVAQQMETLMADPNLHRHARRIAAHMESIRAHFTSQKTDGGPAQTEVAKEEAVSFVEVSRKFIPPLKKIITRKFIPPHPALRGQEGDPLRITTAGTRPPAWTSMGSDPQPVLDGLGTARLLRPSRRIAAMRHKARPGFGEFQKEGSEASFHTLYSKDLSKASALLGEVQAQNRQGTASDISVQPFTSPEAIRSTTPSLVNEFPRRAKGAVRPAASTRLRMQAQTDPFDVPRPDPSILISARGGDEQKLWFAGINAALVVGSAAVVQILSAIESLLPDGWFGTAGNAGAVPLGLLFAAIGVAHFAKKEAFLDIVPPRGTWGGLWQVPAPGAERLSLSYAEYHTYWTGIAEVCGGLILAASAIGLLPIEVQRVDAALLLLLTLAVTPANIYMATHDAQMAGGPPPMEYPKSHLIRGFIQMVLLADFWKLAFH